MSGKLPTIKDVARLAGVSVGTVSNVYSRNRNVRADLVERVGHAATELGYEPNRAASQLRSKKAQVIGVLVPSIDNPYFMRLASLVTGLAREAGYETLIADSEENEALEPSRLATLLAWRPAGMIVVPVSDEFAAGRLFRDNRVPYVVADRLPRLLCTDGVASDNLRAGEDAARYMLQHGHRRLAVAATTLRVANIRDRLDGIRAVYAAAGAPVPVAFEAGHVYEEARDRVGAFLDGHDRPDAVVALTSVTTLGTLAALRERRLAVGSCVALLGFDDYDWMSATTPSISAMRPQVEEMGRIAWERLKARIDGDTTLPATIRLVSEVVHRESVGPG